MLLLFFYRLLFYPSIHAIVVIILPFIPAIIICLHHFCCCTFTAPFFSAILNFRACFLLLPILCSRYSCYHISSISAHFLFFFTPRIYLRQYSPFILQQFIFYGDFSFHYRLSPLSVSPFNFIALFVTQFSSLPRHCTAKRQEC